MTKIEKDTTVTLQVTANDQRTQKPGFVFYSHDYETALINVKINTLEGVTELSEEDTIRIFMRVKQKGQYNHLVYKMMKSEQELQYQFYIPSELLGYEGRVECGVYIEFSTGETLDVGYFDFQMRKSMIDGEFKKLDTIYVKEFSDALEKIKLIADEYETKYAVAIDESQEEFNFVFK